MNELTRMAYLDAMGIDSYISRAQLPGAAASRRLMLVPQRARGAAVAPPVQSAAVPAPLANSAASPVHFPEIQAPRPRPAPVATAGEVAAGAPKAALLRFSVAAIVAGGWVWLEQLNNMPLAREQVQLIQAMSRALQNRASGERQTPAVATEVSSEVALFDWPMHTNQQLDLGADAASAALVSFIRRKREQLSCRGVILLGQACADRVPGQELDCPWAVTSHDTVEMLANSALKQRVWSELKELVPGR